MPVCLASGYSLLLVAFSSSLVLLSTLIAKWAGKYSLYFLPIYLPQTPGTSRCLAWAHSINLLSFLGLAPFPDDVTSL